MLMFTTLIIDFNDPRSRLNKNRKQVNMLSTYTSAKTAQEKEKEV